MEVLLAAERNAIGGACFLVCTNMGRDFLEPVYQECLEIGLHYLACQVFETEVAVKSDSCDSSDSWSTLLLPFPGVKFRRDIVGDLGNFRHPPFAGRRALAFACSN